MNAIASHGIAKWDVATTKKEATTSAAKLDATTIATKLDTTEEQSIAQLNAIVGHALKKFTIP